ncbi:MAG: hypothetical protein U0835_22130 [Isosphaeraceae bacterium]
MTQRVRIGGLVIAMACGVAGCGGGGVEQGVPQDLSPGVPKEDPAMNPQMKAFNKSMIKNEPAKDAAPAPAAK